MGNYITILAMRLLAVEQRPREVVVNLYGEDVVKAAEDRLDDLYGDDSIPWYAKKWEYRDDAWLTTPPPGTPNLDTSIPDLPQCEKDHDLPPREFGEWDDQTSSNLSSEVVRQKWPRRSCLKCGTIVYDSYIHYLAGDY